MSRATIMAQIQTLLQALDRFGNADVTLADWTVLDSGSNDEYAVIWPGPWSSEEDSFGTVKYTWTINVDLLERYLTQVAAYASLDVMNQDVVNHLMKYDDLDDLEGVEYARPTGGDEPWLVYATDGTGPHFIATTMKVVVEETVDIPERGR